MRRLQNAVGHFVRIGSSMTRSPTGIIPQEFNTPAQLSDVLKFLRSLPIPADERQELLFGWSRNVGLKIRRADYESLLD